MAFVTRFLGYKRNVLNMKYKEDFESTKYRFSRWLNGESLVRPLLRIITNRKTPIEPLEAVDMLKTPREYHYDMERRTQELSKKRLIAISEDYWSYKSHF